MKVKNITQALYYDIPLIGTFDIRNKTFGYEIADVIPRRNPLYFIKYDDRIVGVFRLSHMWSGNFRLSTLPGSYRI